MEEPNTRGELPSAATRQMAILRRKRAPPLSLTPQAPLRCCRTTVRVDAVRLSSIEAPYLCCMQNDGSHTCCHRRQEIAPCLERVDHGRGGNRNGSGRRDGRRDVCKAQSGTRLRHINALIGSCRRMSADPKGDQMKLLQDS